MAASAPLSIIRIEVDKLFGYHDYVLPKEQKDIHRFFILYGDNGSGKTTILRIIYGLLVPKSVPDARSFIMRTTFQSVRVYLSDGTKVAAERPIGVLNGKFTFVLDQPGREVVRLDLGSDDDRPVQAPQSIPVISALKELGLSVYFLPDDRKSADLDRKDMRNEISLYRDELGNIQRFPGNTSDNQTRHLEIRPSISQVFSWIRSQVIKGSRVGDENSASIYRSVINRIATHTARNDEEPTDNKAELIRRIEDLGASTKDFSTYGLMRQFDYEYLLKQIELTHGENRKLVLGILKPYIDGIEARKDALKPSYEAVHRFVNNANMLLHPKKVIFSITEGFTILDKKKRKINPDLLSSGEKQIFLIFCHSILSRSRGGIFIIDEPELSLNIKWQRQILDRISNIAGDTPIQFILATHSIDLLAEHRSSTVQLKDIVNGDEKEAEGEDSREWENEEATDGEIL
ncbi:putative AbiEii toxin of type IV toxin-antitoxin system [Nitrospirillum amazonense]|uniref:Putative AbiEii toxin of type IV toxin-antitoxin system n=1 Tax=Nitrospirillum amazonense TaxID=28077 RepID=A0A560JI12_9PROT|nr:AAA family ATPase [Nitrospirillum amazonense]TWB70792.1 putative AbiEii toxin of type IV toxin-antitoxin system [Nitrospirillum amazonense]